MLNGLIQRYNKMKFMVILGTRPEVIKMVPVIKKLRESGYRVTICVTAQQRQMLDQSLGFFGIIPDYDLNVMTDHQDLFYVTTEILVRLKDILTKEKPDIVLVQGDTTTALSASLAAFYLHISVGHIEAGLRTFDKYNPFPEEKNRHLIGVLADYHFAPTELAKNNLIKGLTICEKTGVLAWWAWTYGLLGDLCKDMGLFMEPIKPFLEIHDNFLVTGRFCFKFFL